MIIQRQHEEYTKVKNENKELLEKIDKLQKQLQESEKRQATILTSLESSIYSLKTNVETLERKTEEEQYIEVDDENDPIALSSKLNLRRHAWQERSDENSTSLLPPPIHGGNDHVSVANHLAEIWKQ